MLHQPAEEVSLGGIGGAWLDPARRTTSGGTTRRLADAADYSPSLDFAFGLAERMPVGVKLGPGTDRDVIPAGVRGAVGCRSTATSSSSPSGWARWPDRASGARPW